MVDKYEVECGLVLCTYGGVRGERCRSLLPETGLGGTYMARGCVLNIIQMLLNVVIRSAARGVPNIGGGGACEPQVTFSFRATFS